MSRTNHIDIYTPSNQDMNQSFVDAWEKIEQGAAAPAEHLYFEDAGTLLRVLSNQGLPLLTALRKAGPSSIRSLSKMLQRNYKNVHSDVTLLRKAGLIRIDDQDKVLVPWWKIHTEIDLLAAA